MHVQQLLAPSYPTHLVVRLYNIRHHDSDKCDTSSITPDVSGAIWPQNDKKRRPRHRCDAGVSAGFRRENVGLGLFGSLDLERNLHIIAHEHATSLECHIVNQAEV